jgi:glyoxalase family protein
MKLEGIHHITAITADGPRNADFYTRVLGLRMVKKTVNQDDPTAYHLFYADELGSSGADLTFFEYPQSRRGRAGAGMVYRIVWRVASREVFPFWEARLGREGISTRVDGDSLHFRDPEGLELELRAVETTDAPLVARRTDVPEEVALQGFDGVRAYAAEPARSAALVRETLGFDPVKGDAYDVRGVDRGSIYAYDRSSAPGLHGAGTVHHVAWASRMEDHATWLEAVSAAGARPSPIIDRFYFRSIYFREPSGVLFEIATIGPGFTADEPLEKLGEALSLPPNFEHLRPQLERILTPIPSGR